MPIDVRRSPDRGTISRTSRRPRESAERQVGIDRLTRPSRLLAIA
jgi:hypothetical protein